PAGNTFAEIGSPVRVLVGIGRVRRVPIPDLPPMGVAIRARRGVRLVDLEGGLVAALRGHHVVYNNGGPVYLRHRDAYYLLDPDARALVPVSEREAKRTFLDPPQPDLPEPRGVFMHAGHWRYMIGSPVSDDALGQWSGECGSPLAFWIPPNGEPQLVTGERSLRGAPESIAMGWTPDGDAIVLLPDGLCGGGTSPSGVYLFAAPGDGRLVVAADDASLWTTAEPAMP
ncbi:MAG TPA: hypothetical protein VEC15_01865, partial [Actinomycetota bacterium]|nr:hypothetical protein [Actinomycetota bacterium]